MIKIAISGKAGTGKSTLTDLLIKEYIKKYNNENYKTIAFADPLKAIAKIMAPDISNNCLYGPSEFRRTKVRSLSKYKEITVRELLNKIGTDFGRSLNPSIWIDVFNESCLHFQNTYINQQSILIVSDVRYENEMSYVKNNGFYTVKIQRQTEYNIEHSSETEQENFNDCFDKEILNDKNLEYLENEAKSIINIVN